MGWWPALLVCAIDGGAGGELPGHGDRRPRDRSAVRGLNVELSLPIFRLALAVFIPWRGADGIRAALGMAPALMVGWIEGDGGQMQKLATGKFHRFLPASSRDARLDARHVNDGARSRCRAPGRIAICVGDITI